MGFLKSLFRGKSDRAIYGEYEKLFDRVVIEYTLINKQLSTKATSEDAADIAMRKASSQIMQKYGLTREEMLAIIVKGTTKWSKFKGLEKG